MSDSFLPGPAATGAPQIRIVITPMRRTEEGVWEPGEREGAELFLLDLIHEAEEEVAVVMECRDERTAALAARVAAGTLAALGLGQADPGGAAGGEARGGIFDAATAAILADHATPEVAAPSGEWRMMAADEEERGGGLPS